ncbi:MAG: hypothetical protein ACOZNI_34375 [Myxococcota bacterium]
MIGLVAAALAGGLHAGIPVHGVAGVGEPTFLTATSGWTASVEGGWVRVFVGASEADGDAWYDRAVATLGVTPPALAFADEAHGDGETLLAFRDGNVGVVVRVEAGARAVAERLRAAIVDGGPSPVTPRILRTAEGWACEAPGAVHVAVSGARAVPFRPGLYAEAPREVVAWDTYGRATVAR